MNKITLEMPMVSRCMVSECSYNTGSKCHARAITVGDAIHPRCDTYIASGLHTNHTQQVAGVGACKTVGCQHNEDMECVADSVQVARVKNECKCMTFAMR